MAAPWMIDGYHHRSVFPRTRDQHNAVDDAGATLIDPTVNDPSKPLWIEVTNVDTQPLTVLFTQLNAGTEWMRVTLASNVSIVLPGWDTRGLGLEVYAAAAITDNGFNIHAEFPDGTIAVP